MNYEVIPKSYNDVTSDIMGAIVGSFELSKEEDAELRINNKKEYVITDILNSKSGARRTDDKYPSRIGSAVQVISARIANPGIFAYTKDNQGSPKSGYLLTSLITKIRISGGRYKGMSKTKLIISTLNSTYILESGGAYVN